MKVRKAVIPAAGFGTRLLPATKAMAKEMFPIVDKPTIQFIVEEAKASGIEDILIITGKGKRPIEDHFDSAPELEEQLRAQGKDDLLKLEQETTNIGVNLYFIRQSYQRGLGDAVRLAKSFVANEPFVVMLGDDLAMSKVPLTKQLMDDYEKTHASTLAVMRVPHEEVSKYGVINPTSEMEPGLYNVKNFVEKPPVDKAPSDLAIIGRYLLNPEIFDLLDTQEPGRGGEIQLTDAIDRLNKTQRVFAREFTGKRYDVGNKFGYVQTTIEYGLRHPEIKDELHAYLKKLVAGFDDVPAAPKKK
ncbi:UTP--glucose-1-phosphate uridylyltransferase GalU [Schleiferilactobacillus harbinensis]|jgi:UTP--glucose-1-phosphate uridylyltransferase|uniref:UTP--glucose-1-phosphate uridylyltransferase n=2 Tax=Schleiferilactobacillus harbinensis TaxID=304207 RepID=A0A510TSW9_9LACO|nr:UTP--glucose-1-phosphate uridylyltransferase GalU [Schleiferilactobacillus harbinensis]HAY52867.1 UTP--glucose-1-phosphate uridylyltransferase [Lactobacillus sp.]KRM29223.1 galU protein [Schleiferilactobacillus harbinensis DSM 16991]MCT2907214.1 UTP--glucose-1-phosphate uridylyltransferase GalU [Schleiferilactobacillus harbinensis]QEU45993.1 UTP--glucose-1-phosphate uridylyltransferase GalU [Schleiferilactobacillus harbinensis]QFR22801.1 UTP--glucose-1-phosphate uridylyltransferase GalU [Sc